MQPAPRRRREPTLWAPHGHGNSQHVRWPAARSVVRGHKLVERRLDLCLHLGQSLARLLLAVDHLVGRPAKGVPVLLGHRNLREILLPLAVLLVEDREVWEDPIVGVLMPYQVPEGRELGEDGWPVRSEE